MSPGYWEFISCPRCPTDCGIIVSASQRIATVRAWHDFGTEASPMDISWRVHVATDFTEDWLNGGPRVDYVHGSIRGLWLENIYL